MIETLLLPLDAMPDPLPLPGPSGLRGAFDLTISPPGSKSLTNRALLLAGLARGESELRGALIDADDAVVMRRAIEALGARVRVAGAEARVSGVGGRWKIPPLGVTLDLRNAGTATRFLAAAAMLGPPGAGPVTIDGNARMRARPIGELAQFLTALGATVEWAGARGYPPLKVRGGEGAVAGAGEREVNVGRTASGQFISALLLVSPFAARPFRVRFSEPPTSPSYIVMTMELLRRLGFRLSGGALDREGVLVQGDPAWPGEVLPGFALDIEPDASGATYFWAAAAMRPGARCMIPKLGPDSLQGDARFVDVLERMGARVERSPRGTAVIGGASLRAIEADLSDMPDAAMTAAVVSCFASPTAENPSATTVLGGLRTLRVKETDRLGALRKELGALAARVEIMETDGGRDEALRITPRSRGAALGVGEGNAGLEFETYDDHRMAMSLALASLKQEGVRIKDPACVAKTYPGYWADLVRVWSR
ncbi:MAG: 3-phosphoshikimate 1-carboxyvinyltransferase [Phycisphaerae bacterium]|nr:3-phosphoshikimate 1-carboxyvinyltransferase [Phycisphaerae bacterium]